MLAVAELARGIGQRVAQLSMPSPLIADTGKTSIEASAVGASRARTLAATSATRSAGTRSVLVITAMPRLIVEQIDDVQVLDASAA